MTESFKRNQCVTNGVRIATRFSMNRHGWAFISLGLTWLISGSVSAIPIELPDDHALLSGPVITRSYGPERGSPEQPPKPSSTIAPTPLIILGSALAGLYGWHVYRRRR